MKAECIPRKLSGPPHYRRD